MGLFLSDHLDVMAGRNLAARSDYRLRHLRGDLGVVHDPRCRNEDGTEPLDIGFTANEFRPVQPLGLKTIGGERIDAATCGAVDDGFVSRVVEPGLRSSPSWLADLVQPAVRTWTRHPVPADAVTVWVQVGLGVLMLLQPISLALYTYSFVVTLLGTVMFIIVSKFPD